MTDEKLPPRPRFSNESTSAKIQDQEHGFIARLRRLTKLGDEELGAFAEILSASREIPAERTLVAEGDRPHQLHILVDGWAARVKLQQDGQRQFCALVLPDDVCDIDGLHVKYYDYGLTALTRCTVVTADRRALLALCDTYPQIARALTWLTFVDNSMVNELTVSLGRRSARERLAHMLCELATRLAAVGRATADTFELLLTQEKIGDALGLTSVHVNRTFKQLREAELIAVTHRSVNILDWKRLAREANFSPAYLHLEGMR